MLLCPNKRQNPSPYTMLPRVSRRRPAGMASCDVKPMIPWGLSSFCPAWPGPERGTPLTAGEQEAMRMAEKYSERAQAQAERWRVHLGQDSDRRSKALRAQIERKVREG